MTLEQITHDLASIDRVVYRTDLLRSGIHGWQLGGSGPGAVVTLIAFKTADEMPTDEQWANKLAEVKATHRPSIVMGDRASGVVRDMVAAGGDARTLRQESLSEHLSAWVMDRNDDRGTKREGDKIVFDFIRYDFVRGDHKRVVRVLDREEAVANNALYQHLKGKRRDDDRRS